MLLFFVGGTAGAAMEEKVENGVALGAGVWPDGICSSEGCIAMALSGRMEDGHGAVGDGVWLTGKETTKMERCEQK